MELIFKISSNEKVLSSIIKKHKDHIKLNDLDFISFEDKEEIDFLNSFWFIVKYNDIIDL